MNPVLLVAFLSLNILAMEKKSDEKTTINIPSFIKPLNHYELILQKQLKKKSRTIYELEKQIKQQYQLLLFVTERIEFDCDWHDLSCTYNHYIDQRSKVDHEKLFWMMDLLYGLEQLNIQHKTIKLNQLHNHIQTIHFFLIDFGACIKTDCTKYPSKEKSPFISAQKTISRHGQGIHNLLNIVINWKNNTEWLKQRELYYRYALKTKFITNNPINKKLQNLVNLYVKVKPPESMSATRVAYKHFGLYANLILPST